MKEPVIGFIGLGRMGQPMASRLVDAGFGLVVADLSAPAREALVRRGATPAATPCEVADAADLVFASLPTPAMTAARFGGDADFTMMHKLLEQLAGASREKD